ncbi:exopolysaccharide transport family protein [Mesorhizobium sp. BAC0120]|uniref:GumC family protein n=1 Tax=Mesorhizobium sp. BAC0120 TaxID=3090670 RepID=UPI00298C31A5|nr:exopolysaccharide transport family protein [Mesorhizobium sp. BAC0120]MDW6021435.1 exopolysaccharide transport family protein [Mesorhizobium sp. BAC0120]
MSGGYATASDVDVDLRRLFGSLASNWRRILAVALIATGAAFAIAWLATPLYKGETRILIETRESVFTRPNAGTDADKSVLDEEGVTSQVEVITSTDILKQVAQRLDLSKLPEFDEAADMSLFSRVMVIVGLMNDPNEIPPEERVLKRFREKLKVYRVEKSRVIVIEMSSENQELAAKIPNAVADTYLAVQRDAKLQSNADATEWLAPEIADLTKRVKDAEAKVANFRAQSDLLIGQNNSVLATQQLSEISSELSRVRASRASAEATAESLRAALKSGASLDALPEVLSSELIQRLRERQVQLKADIADLSTTLLDNHPRIRALRSQLADLDAQIRAEAQKILKSLETQAQTAQYREKQLMTDLNTQKAASAQAGGDEVELRALEREAAAQRELLESYLTRYREASSRKDRSYLPADARIFSRAVVPAEPYFPKIIPIVSAAFVGSLLVMAIITLLQELFSGRAMRPAAGSRFEPVPEVEMPAVREEQPASAEASRQPEIVTDVVSPVAKAEPVEPEPAAPAAAPGMGEISVESAADRLIARGAARAIFVSPEGDEAAATAVLVAREVADAGLRVLLLDLTASGAASQPMLESGAYPGVTNLLASEAQFADVIHADLYSDCHVIPVGTADPVRAMRAADRLPIIMDSLTTAYDVVVVECGPADPESIGRLVGSGTEILVSVLETDDSTVTEAAKRLEANGYEGVTLVTPVGYVPPRPPLSGRNAA